MPDIIDDCLQLINKTLSFGPGNRDNQLRDFKEQQAYIGSHVVNKLYISILKNIQNKEKSLINDSTKYILECMLLTILGRVYRCGDCLVHAAFVTLHLLPKYPVTKVHMQTKLLSGPAGSKQIGHCCNILSTDSGNSFIVIDAWANHIERSVADKELTSNLNSLMLQSLASQTGTTVSGISEIKHVQTTITPDQYFNTFDRLSKILQYFSTQITGTFVKEVSEYVKDHLSNNAGVIKMEQGETRPLLVNSAGSYEQQAEKIKEEISIFSREIFRLRQQMTYNKFKITHYNDFQIYSSDNFFKKSSGRSTLKPAGIIKELLNRRSTII